jgi:hypothetical protein
LKLTFDKSARSVISYTDTAGIKYKWAETDTSYNFEFALPFSKTLHPLPIAGDGFGFDIQINAIDSTNGVHRTRFWKGSIQDTSDTRLFGSIILSNESNDQPSDIQTTNKTPDLILYQNYPDPFSQNSTIKYYIPDKGQVTLKVYDLLGKEVKTLVNQIQNEGNYSILIDATTYKSGIYIYCLQYGSYSISKKFTLVK